MGSPEGSYEYNKRPPRLSQARWSHHRVLTGSMAVAWGRLTSIVLHTLTNTNCAGSRAVSHSHPDNRLRRDLREDVSNHCQI